MVFTFHLDLKKNQNELSFIDSMVVYCLQYSYIDDILSRLTFPINGLLWSKSSSCCSTFSSIS
jgi:hypothetical protein